MNEPNTLPGKAGGEIKDMPAFILGACSKEISRPKLGTPFFFAPWTMATNGWILAAGRGDFGATIEPPVDVAHILALFADKDYETLPFDLAAFQTWLGEDKIEPECTKCHGKGAVRCTNCEGDSTYTCECMDCGHQHETDCPDCDGEGTVECPTCKPSARKRDYARIYGTTFDRSVIRPVVQHLSLRDATWSRHPTDQTRFIRITGGDDWFVIVMPCRDDAEIPAENTPFPLSSSPFPRER